MHQPSFSALQRAEIAEIEGAISPKAARVLGFSALQRAEIAEISAAPRAAFAASEVSVLFNEPKLLKSGATERLNAPNLYGFSALQRAEIAEIFSHPTSYARVRMFQCSSTSRNC